MHLPPALNAMLPEHAADGTCGAGVIAHGSLIKLEDVEAIQRWDPLPHNIGFDELNTISASCNNISSADHPSL